jgi:hypothetical protein
LSEPDPSSLAKFIRAAEQLRMQQPDAAKQAEHLAAIAAETARLRGTDPAPRRPVVVTVLRSRWTRAAGIGIAAVLATGSLAAAKVLPAPVQDAVASVADVVGIDLPRSGEADALDLDLDGDGIPAADDADDRRLLNESISDLDEDGIPAARDPDDVSRIKDGADHEGDGIPDDSGEHKGHDPDKDLGPPSDEPGTPPDDNPAREPTSNPGNKPDDPPDAPDAPGAEQKDEAPATPGRPDDPRTDTEKKAGQTEDREPGRPDDTRKDEPAEG